MIARKTQLSSTKTAGLSWAVIETSLGWCGVAGGDQGLIRIVLPEPSREAVVRVLGRLCGGAHASGRLLPEALRLQRYFDGKDLEGLWRLDLRGATAFQRRVWEALQRIPRGAVSTYGKIAAQLGRPGAARAVGTAAGSNPFPVVVPCHRLVRAGGELGGFSATGGWQLKAAMLRREGVAVHGRRVAGACLQSLSEPGIEHTPATAPARRDLD
jgi:methylated-DNA-[protein]-cysteine S-methyltransferase